MARDVLHRTTFLLSWLWGFACQRDNANARTDAANLLSEAMKGGQVWASHQDWGGETPKQVEDSIWHHAESGQDPASYGPGTKACGEGEAGLTPPSTAVLLLH